MGVVGVVVRYRLEAAALAHAHIILDCAELATAAAYENLELQTDAWCCTTFVWAQSTGQPISQTAIALPPECPERGLLARKLYVQSE